MDCDRAAALKEDMSLVVAAILILDMKDHCRNNTIDVGNDMTASLESAWPPTNRS